MKKGDYYDISELNFDEFLRLHQFLEDNGNKMYTSTKTRSQWGTKPDYPNLAWGYEGICGSRDPDKYINKLNNSNFEKESNYEIY